MRLTSAAGVLFASVVLVGCQETFEKQFDSMAEREAHGMVARGWIPSGLPPNGTNARVRWNIDNNLVRGTMTVPEDELALLDESLDLVPDDATIPFHTRGFVTPSWWPSELRPPKRSSEFRSRGWQLYATREWPEAFVAVRLSDRQLFFWSEGG